MNILQRALFLIVNLILISSKKLKNLPFRNELIENTSHTKIINDSKSTNLENSIIKINQINLKKKIIILGGNPKKSNHKKKYYKKFFNSNIWTK